MGWPSDSSASHDVTWDIGMAQSKMTILMAGNWCWLLAGSFSSPLCMEDSAFSQHGDWIPRKSILSSEVGHCRSPEAQPLKVTKHHFYHILLVKGSHRTNADSREGNIHSTSWWDGWQKNLSLFLIPCNHENFYYQSLQKVPPWLQRSNIIWSKVYMCWQLLMSELKLLSPVITNLSMDFIRSSQVQSSQASGMSKGSGPGSRGVK